MGQNPYCSIISATLFDDVTVTVVFDFIVINFWVMHIGTTLLHEKFY